MQYVPIGEAEAATGQAIVAAGVVIEEGADVEGAFGRRTHQGSRHGLLYLMETSLVPIVVLWPVLHRQVDVLARTLERLRCSIVSGPCKVNLNILH